MRRRYRDLLAEKVLVRLKSGTTFEGIVWAEGREHLTLRGACQILDNGEASPPADGEVWLERVNIDYLQRLTVGPRG